MSRLPARKNVRHRRWSPKASVGVCGNEDAEAVKRVWVSKDELACFLRRVADLGTSAEDEGSKIRRPKEG